MPLDAWDARPAPGMFTRIGNEPAGTPADTHSMLVLLDCHVTTLQGEPPIVTVVAAMSASDDAKPRPEIMIVVPGGPESGDAKDMTGVRAVTNV